MNLASRPFANIRPLRRVAVALWLLGAALAVFAGVLYWRSLFGIEGGRDKLAAVERSMEAERRRLAAAETALAGMDLRRQNVEASYLEARIRERTFPWSGLFEHLAEVLPRHVRLASLSPLRARPGSSPAARSRRVASVASAGRVHLQLTGSAADDEALTDLLDHLFASGWFANPTLPTERRDQGAIDFALNVSYLPGGGRGPAVPGLSAPPPAPRPTLIEGAPDGRSAGASP